MVGDSNRHHAVRDDVHADQLITQNNALFDAFSAMRLHHSLCVRLIFLLIEKYSYSLRIIATKKHINASISRSGIIRI